MSDTQDSGRIEKRVDQRKVGFGGDDWEPTLGRVDQADREDRDDSHASWPGTSWRAAYATLIGEAPAASPGDTGTAAAYLERIEGALEREGGWTKSERGRLYKLRDKWLKRAQGEDPVYQVMGNRRSGWTNAERAEISRVRAIIEIGRIARGEAK